MIKKIKVEIVEEKHKRTYKNSSEIKAGALAQDKMRELAKLLTQVLAEFGVLQVQGGDDE